MAAQRRSSRQCYVAAVVGLAAVTVATYLVSAGVDTAHPQLSDVLEIGGLMVVPLLGWAVEGAGAWDSTHERPARPCVLSAGAIMFVLATIASVALFDTGEDEKWQNITQALAGALLTAVLIGYYRHRKPPLTPTASSPSATPAPSPSRAKTASPAQPAASTPPTAEHPGDVDHG
jgi:hypothetical protein